MFSVGQTLLEVTLRAEVESHSEQLGCTLTKVFKSLEFQLLTMKLNLFEVEITKICKDM